ncbi:(d)CMP kinase [Tissierella creatinophila]|uniref:Cytidylate kinase n=1 Tax=Tissierella creatinophila DSM 6911 TaxID=1123403 RepID=A0A1U7M9S4_TISCR|nr:(d)CMP kinase [Tissierella creatinophila]OLS03959.1 cytidylate kinase [Tissierella creatinophila DSM 6911]
MQNECYSIAIDGPASSGKSTIAKEVSKILNMEYIDTGAMYRALTWKVLENNLDPKDKKLVLKLLETTNIDFKDGNIYLDGKVINDEIRLNYVSQSVSYIAIIPEVRQKMVELQQNMARCKNIVMDGRDIGTVVLTNAKYKFFLTATIEERALRRYKELNQNGDKEINLKVLEEDIRKRDKIDSNREADPLKQAEDAILIDTTEKSIKEVVDAIVLCVKGGNTVAL